MPSVVVASILHRENGKQVTNVFLYGVTPRGRSQLSPGCHSWLLEGRVLQSGGRLPALTPRLWLAVPHSPEAEA